MRAAALAATLAAALAPAAATDAASPQLAAALGRALAAPGIDPARTSALVVDLRTGAVVYSDDAERPLLPASTEKLAVALAALRLLGPAYRFRTDVVASGELADRTWRGNVFLVGRGDPTLAQSDLDALARDVASWGIERIEGRILGDEGRFDARRDAPGWKTSYVGVESRPLSALSVAGVRVRGANGSAVAAARAFRAALARRGVEVTGRAGTGRAPEDGVPLAADLSEPLAVVVRALNRQSDNFAAELVLKELGAAVAGRGTTAAGARVTRRALEEAGVPLAGVRLADGSGLSARDRLTANALVTILRTGASDPFVEDAFVTSLAVAGVSGTLEKRLDRRATRGRVIAKTGTTGAASTLAGFVRRRYAFAIMQNGAPVPYWTARAAQDRFVTLLARS